MWGKGVSKCDFFLVFFALLRVSHLAFMGVPVFLSALDPISNSYFLCSWYFMGAFWEPSWASRGFLHMIMCSKNHTNACIFKVFCKCPIFWMLKSVMALLGSSLPSWSAQVPKWHSKWYPRFLETVEKLLYKLVKKNSAKIGGKMGSKIGKKWDRRLKAFFTTEAFILIFLSFFCMAFWRSLGVSWAALGPLEGLMGGLWTQKH